MYIVTSLLISNHLKKNGYNLILVIVNRLKKLIHEKHVKNCNNVSGMTKLIIYVIVKYNNLSGFIISNRSILFTFKFWLLLRYFLSIKLKLFTIFPLKTNSLTKK